MYCLVRAPSPGLHPVLCCGLTPCLLLLEYSASGPLYLLVTHTVLADLAPFGSGQTQVSPLLTYLSSSPPLSFLVILSWLRPLLEQEEAFSDGFTTKYLTQHYLEFVE